MPNSNLETARSVLPSRNEMVNNRRDLVGLQRSKGLQSAPRRVTNDRASELHKYRKGLDILAHLTRLLPYLASVTPSDHYAQLPEEVRASIAYLQNNLDANHADFRYFLTRAYAEEMRQRGINLGDNHQPDINRMRAAYIRHMERPTDDSNVARSRRRRSTATSAATTPATGAASSTNGQTPPLNADEVHVLYTLIAAQINRVDAYDTILEDMTTKMETLTDFLNASQPILNKLYEPAPDGSTTRALHSSIIDFMEEYDLAIPNPRDKQLTENQYRQYATSIEGLIEKYNNESQMQIFELQRTVGYRNQVIELITNTFSRIIRTYDMVIGNIK